ncbi:FERM and PDZ domain-containing protein 1 isoform X2 [Hemicordylus capensis]|uniref:FERM and PDZ domain-containing protein 1 isoform X2 n=1 Tax=Hemicordylus capensis TaxID=884348 RepID=UPI00230200B9|nr:FERM and PDZ domain-containing protein 1 isoform X2 [Hemicordylus capensis]
MEDLETRKARRIELMVAKWLRRSRDHSSRGRASVSDRPTDVLSHSVSHIKITVDVRKDILLGHYGFEVSQNPPLLITSVAVGSAADGKLLPGDQILAINNETAEGVTGEQAASLLRESEESIRFTVLRCISGGPKSSFLTAEKRAKLKTNPVKVRFAEEVVVNGHTQDILLTLKEKLSIRSIDHFALVLEEQYNVLKMYLLHEDELIEQVVQRKESHNYRCLFRVCFIPRDPLDMLQQDPIAFEYLYLQSCSDVLQERFAVEMKCSVALRLAALHIQERIITCAQPQKVSLKYIEKDWGIENFISPTLLRNMRGKDIKKAISFHMKRNQLLLDPRPKRLLSAAQVRLCYLQILGDLKLYGGKIFNATLMLQDRESCIALLVGAKYGISQVVNNKLNIVTMLAEFANISRLELTEESDKVSMVKIYLQDIKLLTLLLESNSAKDLACLIAGYYKLLVDSSSSIFVWTDRRLQTHRLSAEEGYESRTCSDSEESSEPDSSLDRFPDTHSTKYSSISPLLEEGEQDKHEQERKELEDKETVYCNGYDNTNDSLSDASDSANTESRLKTSASSDSLDALEEDDLQACSSSRPEFFHFYTPTLQELASNGKTSMGIDSEEGSKATQEYIFSFFPPPHIPSPVLLQLEAEPRTESETNASALESKLAESNVMQYYSLCANISPTSSGEKTTCSDSSERGSLKELQAEADEDEGTGRRETPGFILAPPPGFGDTSSDEEFYDAAERVAPVEAPASSESLPLQSVQDVTTTKVPSCCGLSQNILSRQSRRAKHRPEKEARCTNSLRKRRSFLQTNYTSQVTFPIASPHSPENIDSLCYDKEPGLSDTLCSEPVVSLRDTKRDTDLETKSLVQLDPYRATKNITPSSELMEMEPDTLETKTVTDSVASSISAIRLLGTQEAAESSDFNSSPLYTEKPDTSFISSHTHEHNSCLKVSGISFRVEGLNKIGHEKTEDPTETYSGVEKHCIAGREPHVNEISENTMRTAESTPEIGVSYVLIEEIIHTTTKPSRSLDRHQGKQLTCVPTSDLDPLPAEKVERDEQLVLGPCERGIRDPLLHKSSQAFGGLLLPENTSKMLTEDSLRKSEGPNQLSFSNDTELLPHCDDPSGIQTHLSGVSFSSLTNCTETCLQSDDKCWRTAGQSVPVVNRVCLKEDDLLSDGLRQGPHHPSALTAYRNTSLSTELAGVQKSVERNFTGNAFHVDYKCKQPRPQTVSVENMEQKKANISDGLDYFSLASFCKSAGPSEKNGVSNQTFLYSDSTEGAKAPVSCNNTGSPAFTTAEALSPNHKMDRCSCQLTYASCFRGLDNEAELKDTSPLECGTSERPLTTPPSTRSPLSLDCNPTRLIQECNYANTDPKSGKNRSWLPESHIDALRCLKETVCASPLDFSHLLENVVELQEILRKFGGNRRKHPRDKCSAHFSENKNILCMESQRLTSSCQKVIKADGPSTEIQNVIQETFQNLLQLTDVCFQFTNCSLCSRRLKDLTINLKDLVCNYRQFVQAAQQACEQGYSTLSVKLLVCQYTALTAALFCLVQQFRASSCV